ncbi:MAG: nucleotide exchange factor GrpE [bacterium]|nr:nucleotide exchange factor GrpE [bacterium]
MSKPHKDDLEFEPTEEVIDETAHADKIKKLRIELKDATDKARDYLAGWQRSKADYLNLQKSEAALKNQALKLGQERVLMDLITVADSFDLAMSNKQAWEEVSTNWRQGVEYIYKELQNIFQNYNLEVINPPGGDFNPEYHHAIGTLPAPSPSQSGQVANVLQKGYKLGEKIIRPAQVKTYE